MTSRPKYEVLNLFRGQKVRQESDPRMRTPRSSVDRVIKNIADALAELIREGYTPEQAMAELYHDGR